MALYDKILSEYFDGEKLSEQKTSEILDDINSILKNGPNASIGIPVPLKYQFQTDPVYQNIDLKEDIFSSLKDKIVNGLLKNVFTILNLNGQTPFPFIFDVTGLLPNLQIPQGLSLSTPITPIQLLLLLEIPEETISQKLFLNRSDILVSEIKDLTIDELRITLPKGMVDNFLLPFLKEEYLKIPSVSITQEQLQDLFNPLKIVSIPRPPQFSISFNSDFQKTTKPILDMLQVPGLDLSLTNKLEEDISEFQKNIIQQYVDIVTIPIELIKQILAEVFSNISTLNNPISLFQALIETVIDLVINKIFPNPPGVELSNQNIVIKLAVGIVAGKHILKAISSLVVGSFLGKGTVSENISKLI